MDAKLKGPHGLDVMVATNTHALREIFLFRERIKALAGFEDEISYLDERVAAQPDDRVVAVFAKRGDHIVGSAYIHFHIFGGINSALAELHHIDAVLEFVDKEEIAIVTGLTVHPIVEAADVVTALMRQIYELVLQAGCSICYALAAEGPAETWRAYGFRQYRTAAQKKGLAAGPSVVASLRDAVYLATLLSPACELLGKAIDRDHGRRISGRLFQIYHRRDVSPYDRPSAPRFMPCDDDVAFACEG
jgi:hypothetical protein